MGIRYVARPILEQDADDLRANPDRWLCCGPLADVRGPDGSEWASLDLDKAWREMQMMFGRRSSEPRIALSLVDGDVTPVPDGWRSYRGFLDPDEVRLVGGDLALFSREHGLQAPGEEHEYARQYAAKARDYVASGASAGLALVYWIA